MITITHNRARLTVHPEHAEQTRELLAIVDKSKGKKGRKLPRDKGNPKHDSSKRYFPAFEPGMSTGEYLRQYAVLNAHVHLLPVSDAFDHDHPAPMLDPSIPGSGGGIMRTINYSHYHGEGLTLKCELEYSPAEQGTETDPAWPASAVLITARVGGVDISPLLSDYIVAMIEEGAVWSQS